MSIIHSFRALYALNVPKEALLLVVIWTHLEARILSFFNFFSNVNNIANTYLSHTHTIVFLQLLVHLTMCDLPRMQTSVFSPIETLWNFDSQRNHHSWYEKPDSLYYYILSYILCSAVTLDHHERIPPFYLPSPPFPSSPPAFASYGAKSVSKVRVHSLRFARQQRDRWVSQASLPC